MKASTRSISLPMEKSVGQQERSAESESGLEIHPKNRTSTTVDKVAQKRFPFGAKTSAEQAILANKDHLPVGKSTPRAA